VFVREGREAGERYIGAAAGGRRWVQPPERPLRRRWRQGEKRSDSSYERRAPKASWRLVVRSSRSRSRLGWRRARAGVGLALPGWSKYRFGSLCSIGRLLLRTYARGFIPPVRLAQRVAPALSFIMTMMIHNVPASVLCLHFSPILFFKQPGVSLIENQVTSETNMAITIVTLGD
jgi:hypothetical protein